MDFESGCVIRVRLRNRIHAFLGVVVVIAVVVYAVLAMFGASEARI